MTRSWTAARPWTACWRPLLFAGLGLGLLALAPMCAPATLKAGAAGLIAATEAKGAAALAAAGQSWARLTIDTDGVARVVGTPPRPEDAAAALAVVRTALAAETGFPGVVARFAPVTAAPTPPPSVPPTAPLVAAPAAPAPPPQATPVAAADATIPPDPALLDAAPPACERAMANILRTQPIRFASGSAQAAGVGRENFRPLAAAANACDRHRLLIAGHTDDIGAASFNQRLSLARAQAVHALLIAAGVEATALDTIGYGEARPLDQRRTPAALAANRRIEILVTPR